MTPTELAKQRISCNVFDDGGYVGHNHLSRYFTNEGCDKFDQVMLDARTIAAALDEAEREKRELKDQIELLRRELEHRDVCYGGTPTTVALAEGKTHE